MYIPPAAAAVGSEPGANPGQAAARRPPGRLGAAAAAFPARAQGAGLGPAARRRAPFGLQSRRRCSGVAATVAVVAVTVSRWLSRRPAVTACGHGAPAEEFAAARMPAER